MIEKKYIHAYMVTFSKPRKPSMSLKLFRVFTPHEHDAFNANTELQVAICVISHLATGLDV